MKSSKRWLSLLLAFVMLFTSFDSAVLAAGAALAPKAQTTELKGVVKGKKEIFNFTVPQTGEKTAVKSRVKRGSGFFRAGTPVMAPGNPDTEITVNTKGLGSNAFDWSALPNNEFKITARWETSDGQKHRVQDFATISKEGKSEFAVGWPTDGTMVGDAAIEIQYDQDINVRVLFTPETSAGQIGKLSFTIDLTELANSMVDVKYVDPYGKPLAAENMPAQGSTMPDITSDSLTGVAMPLPTKSATVNMRDSEDINEDELHAAAMGVAYKVGDKGDGEKVTIGGKEYTLSISDPNPKKNATVSLRYEPDVLVPDRGDDGRYPDVPEGYVRLTFKADEKPGTRPGKFNDLGEKEKVIDVKEGLKYSNAELQKAIAALKPIPTLPKRGTAENTRLVFEKWTPDVPTDDTEVTTAEYTAKYGSKYSNKDVIPYVPEDKENPTKPDDPNIPTKDDDGKEIDRDNYVIVAFKVSPQNAGKLSLGEVKDQAVISALVKKDTKWADITLPSTKAEGDYTFWYWSDAKGEKVAEGEIRTAKFIKSGDEIDPNDKNPLPNGFHKVNIVKGTGVEDNALFGKTYAVKKGDTLAKDKFPELTAAAGYKKPAWNVENPWTVPVADEDVTYTASAISATFDKDNVTKMVVKTQPKLTYVEGSADNGKLDLTNLVVTLTDKNGNTQDVPFDKLGEYGITANPAHDSNVTVDGNNGKPVTLTKGKLTATTDNLTVTKENTPQASEKPKVDQPYVGDEKITGKGVPGATIVVKDKNGDEIGTTKVKDDKTWEVTVPPAEPLQKGETITATQTETGKTSTDSDPVTVLQRPQPAGPTITDPKAKNEPGKDSTTVTGRTDPNTEVTVTDKDGNEIGKGKSDPNGNFTIETKPKQDPGTEVTITPKDGTPAKATVTEENPGQSETPTINQPTEGDNVITGMGKPGAEVVVTDKDGKEIGKTTVGTDGKWSVPVPADRPLKKGETITATQTEDGKKPASDVTIVKGKDSGNTGDNGGYWFIPTIPSVEKPKHETAIHKLYIYGYEDSTFRPEGDMTRAEAAAMLARLQGLDLSNSARPNFMDVRSGWYNAAINAVVNAGYMKGYPDGTFRPNGKITRAEFAQMIKAIDKANTGMAPFADAKGHWAEAAINQAYANGRIAGYPDGTFRPNDQITRAEAVTIFNKLYDRHVEEPGIADVKSRLVEFNDINRGHWAYFQVVEASNTHEFYRTEKGKVDETWVRVLQNWKEALANR